MLSKGDVFVYGMSGVCRIEDICVKDLGMMKKEYYILRPVYDERSMVYVPTDSEKFEEKAKALLTKEEAYEMLDNIPERDLEWISNDKERSEIFKNALEEGTRLDLIRLIQVLHCRKNELFKKGKKLRSADENIMLRAEKLIYGEFAWVLGIKPEEAMKLINEKLDK